MNYTIKLADEELFERLREGAIEVMHALEQRGIRLDGLTAHALQLASLALMMEAGIPAETAIGSFSQMARHILPRVQ